MRRTSWEFFQKFVASQVVRNKGETGPGSCHIARARVTTPASWDISDPVNFSHSFLQLVFYSQQKGFSAQFVQ